MQVASFAVLVNAVSATICDAATWASTYTYTRFYQLNIAVSASAVVSRRVLQIAGTSNLVLPVDKTTLGAAYRWTGRGGSHQQWRR